MQSGDEVWDIHLESWITMDWGYNEVARGDLIESAIGFACDTMVATTERRKRATPLEGHARGYRVVAEVMEVWLDNGWVIDCGLRANTVVPVPQGITRGDFVSGDIDFHIDYPERDVVAIPEWEVVAITRCEAPAIPPDDEEMRRRYPKFRVPDMARLTRTEVERTDGWGDRQGSDVHAWYILHCRKRASDGGSVNLG